MRKVVVAVFTAGALAVIAAVPAGAVMPGAISRISVARIGPADAAAIRSPTRQHRWTKVDRSAARFMVKLVRQKLADQNELAWQALYPLHQSIATLEAFVACQRSIPVPGALRGVRVLRVIDGLIRIAGQSGTAKSKAVTVRVSVGVDFWPYSIVVVQTMHAVAVGGDWTWILSPAQYEAYSAGNCP